MSQNSSQRRFGFCRSHPGLCIGILILVTFGALVLSNYCNAVYIGQRAFVCKIIGMVISLVAFWLFCWGLISLGGQKRGKEKPRGLRKTHPQLYRYGRLLYRLLILAGTVFLSIRTVYPVMADVAHGSETAVVSYIGMDSERRKVARFYGHYTLFHLHFHDANGREITINLTHREFDRYRNYFESLHHQELTFYRHTHVAVLPETP